MSPTDDRELDRALAQVPDPAMPAGLVERILATVPHLPQEGAVPAAHPAPLPLRQRRQVRPAALAMIAAGFAALAVFIVPASAPMRGPAQPRAPAPAAQLVAAAPVVMLPSAVQVQADLTPRARKAPPARGVAAPQLAQVEQPVAASLAPADVLPEPVLAAAGNLPHKPKLGPPVPDDLRPGDGTGPSANPLAPAPQTGFGFRGGSGD